MPPIDRSRRDISIGGFLGSGKAGNMEFDFNLGSGVRLPGLRPASLMDVGIVGMVLVPPRPV